MLLLCVGVVTVMALSKMATDRLHELHKHYRMQDYVAQVNLARETLQVLEASTVQLENRTRWLKRQVAEERRRRQQLDASAEAPAKRSRNSST